MKVDTNFGDQNNEVWENTADWMTQAGLITKEANLEGIFVNMED